MFNIKKFEFSKEQFKQTVIIEECDIVKYEIKTYLDIDDQNKKTVVCKISSKATNDDVYKCGDVLSNELDDNFNVELKNVKNINLSHLIESVLLGLTPVNMYSKEYKLPQTVKVNAEFEFETAYIDGYNSAYSYNITRILNHLPYNDCNPSTMCNFVSQLFTMANVNITILRKDECEKLNLQGMLTLSKASRFEPSVIKIEYKSDITKKNIALVGKGVTFDTGGYSIKTGRDISDMKTDMGGANAVLGTLHYLATTKAKANVTGYLMLTDNMINNQAMIPGDVITYDNKLSVEIGNTDAEGRLILADGILLATKDGAEQVIDIATLTGNSVAALGIEYAAMYSNDDSLAHKMLEVNKMSTDKVWHMPLVQEYKSTLNGNISDLRNISSMSYAGGITAALFLEAFVNNIEWIHVDMAAQTERAEYGTKYSGYGVRLLTNYISIA